ncbi:MAG: hypothetical protein M3Y28_02050 [Armatimonadota bacterium]|nr:hypothetical protein [Armatimonadota bacterium]
MSTQLESAQAELTPDVRREINWFTPPGERRFVDAAAISAAATVLLGLFYSGMLEGLKETVKAEGKKTGLWLGEKIAERLRAITSGHEQPDPAQTEQTAQAARAALQGQDQKQVGWVFDEVETEMRTSFAQVMPDGRAATFATRVRHVAVRALDAGKVSPDAMV